MIEAVRTWLLKSIRERKARDLRNMVLRFEVDHVGLAAAIKAFNKCDCVPFRVTNDADDHEFRCAHCGVLWGFTT